MIKIYIPNSFLCPKYLFICLILIYTIDIVFVSSTPLPSDIFLDIDGISIAPGADHMCVIEAHAGTSVGGKVKCWGNDEYGKLDAPQNRFFVQVVSGQFFSCGITIEQRAVCWGKLERPTKDIPGLFTQLSADRFAICGLMTDGLITCWGRSPIVNPTLLPKLEEGKVFVQVSCAVEHCCALDDEGHVHCWGGSKYADEMQPPVKRHVVDMEGNKLSVSQSAEDEDEDLYDGSAAGDETAPAGLSVEIEHVVFRQVSVGQGFSCGIRLEDGAMQCWGEAKRHRMSSSKTPGFGSLFASSSSTVVSGPFRQVSVGRLGVCAILEDDGTLACWGQAKNIVPEGGGGGGDGPWDQVSVRYLGVCAVSQTSLLQCWGGAAVITEQAPQDIEIA
eukprot:gene4789-9547_t